MKRNYLFIIIALATWTSLEACRKNSSPNLSVFYGAWKTSYGDTILFARENGKNILTYKYSMNPSMPAVTKSEFNYRDNKLELKGSFVFSPDFTPVSSFSWVNPGSEFTVLGIEWFSFLSSSTTYFTFTKLP